jgi:AraC-like DNA-binding protein
MVQSRVFTFTDADAYQEAIRAGQVAVVIQARGEFRAELVRIDFDRLWMQWGSESLPRIARATVDPKRAAMMFIADAQQPPTQLGGGDVAKETIGVYGYGSTNLARTQAGSRWATLSLSHADLAAAGEAIAGREIVCPSDTYLDRPAMQALARLRAVHAKAIGLARTQPQFLAAPAVAKSLEQELTQAMIATLAGQMPAERRWLPGQHAGIVARFEQFLESRPFEPVYIAEICATIGASERTLRTCCQEILGVGPVRYLWLRRMHLVRQKLLHSESSATTVTEIATTCGFWELGRFSVEYRGLFGESPSTTLRRSQ